jgi:zinc protease
MKKYFLLLFSVVLTLLSGCRQAGDGEVSLAYEKFTLDNGLEVILHPDTSDPVVSVAIQFHVGSNREKSGKTGFAHFFEHMLFQRSENLPRNAFFQKIDALGGDFNGGTWNDGTIYYETVPRDALEKVLWMESDRMGFFINTVTQGGLEREIDVVSNEKRQGENRPYGMLGTLMAKYVYPAGHPYSWTVIGEIPDLQSATIDDVKEFYRTYYVPGNATLAIAGDFDPKQAKDLVIKYFDEIPAGVKPDPLQPRSVSFDAVRRVSHEDAYASAPMLSVVYPSVEMYHPDGYALDFLTMLLSSDKKSPLYKILVEEKKLTAGVSMYNEQMELAGLVTIRTTTFPGVSLDSVYAAIGEAYARFEQTGIDERDLERYKTMMETRIYNGLVSTLGKAMTLAESNVFAGNPDNTREQLDKYRAVTREDVMRVYEQYVKGKNYFALSIVPAGQAVLALAGSTPAVIEQEPIGEQALRSDAGEIVDDPYERTPSRIDRSVEPPLMANTPALRVPEIWSTTLSNGMTLKGIVYSELPLVGFYIRLNDGMLHDLPGKPGVAAMTAQMLNEGTEFKTPEELQEAKDRLGASLSVSIGAESMMLTGTCLKKNFAEVIALAEEILLHPRWDETSLEIVRERNLDNLRQMETQPSSIASSVFRKLLFGRDNILSNHVLGTAESVPSITMDDLKAFYAANFSPKAAAMGFVGGLRQAEVEKTLAPLTAVWAAAPAAAPAVEPMVLVDAPAPAAKVWFIDYPGSSQSYILMGSRAMPFNSPEAWPATIVNDRLGASSGSLLFEILRLQRGYTYGAYSAFTQGNANNYFAAQSSVQATVTRESLEIFRDILTGYRDAYSEEYLETTRTSLLRALNGSFETPGAQINMIYAIDANHAPMDYVVRKEETLRTMTLEQAREHIARDIVFDKMVIVVVGDAASQLANVERAGLGPVLLVDKNADPVR